jgi:bilirubin oxidase
MKFVVGTLSSKDTTVPPDHLTLPPFAPLGAADNTRQISLSDIGSQTFTGVPIYSRLGTLNADGTASSLAWADPISEMPKIDTTEIWELTNFTADAHPIHIHQVEFEVVNRQPNGGAVAPPEVWETGTKDTVIAYPGAVTRFKAHFDIPGRYVYHGRVADHEDNEMRRPYMVVSDQVTALPHRSRIGVATPALIRERCGS